MRLSSYLIESYDKSTRTELLTEKDFYNLLEKNCKDSVNAYVKHGQVIYRGSLSSDIYSYGDASKFQRVSRNTSNFYTLWIDNRPQWDDYPKRGSSFICSTSRGTADGYGDVKIVFPYDGTKIGVCNKVDFWETSSTAIGMELEEFNRVLNSFISDILGIDKYDSSYENLLGAIKEVDKYRKQNKFEFENRLDSILSRTGYEGSIIEKIINDKGMEEAMDKILSPKTLNTKVLKAGDKISGNVEVWLEGPALFVDYDTIYKDPTKLEAVIK